jgi:hypothetical protein
MTVAPAGRPLNRLGYPRTLPLIGTTAHCPRHERAFVWHDPRVDRAYYEEIAGQLHGLLIRLDVDFLARTSP